MQTSVVWQNLPDSSWSAWCRVPKKTNRQKCLWDKQQQKPQKNNQKIAAVNSLRYVPSLVYHYSFGVFLYILYVFKEKNFSFSGLPGRTQASHPMSGGHFFFYFLFTSQSISQSSLSYLPFISVIPSFSLSSTPSNKSFYTMPLLVVCMTSLILSPFL